ncbi:uncharacterized protein LOC117180041 isoform X1 [Belonocnema kinseyi]|uniref:uncharacterized protein LOC117180041 isoform X1 n=1 Tax=Belonocnema kinseyi TaxID=2817044 RepID=UPI00143DD984|nr:uncharacterized protein LOC117180041 isoform X1 [Belonocnema kinseyi]
MPGKVVFAVLLTIATLFSTSFPDVAIVTDPNETAYVNCLRNCSTNENNPFCIQYFTQIVGVGNQEFSCLNRCGAGQLCNNKVYKILECKNLYNFLLIFFYFLVPIYKVYYGKL